MLQLVIEIAFVKVKLTWAKNRAFCLNRGLSLITQISRIFDFEISSGIQLSERLVACFDIIRVI